ncbi:three-helix bundle dimerization domain-containing protein [Streptomyces sp. NPDC058683]|uniref:three-helix bundle dimerization domain-containing protein n=1 Tax=Streptomyces sp. NPDC058683 TaxID=3346597 RepID=UPI00364C09AD
MSANTAETRLPDTLEKLTDHLTALYADLLTAAVVRDVVQDCYQPLSNARIATYVPILVEHDSRTVLRRLARRPGPMTPLREESDT